MKGTIKSKADIEDMFKCGKHVSTKGILFILLPERSERGRHGRVAFIAGKKIGNAPARNRCKRIMRHAAVVAGAPWDGLDVVMVARKPLERMEFEQIVEDCRNVAIKGI